MIISPSPHSAVSFSSSLPKLPPSVRFGNNGTYGLMSNSTSYNDTSMGNLPHPGDGTSTGGRGPIWIVCAIFGGVIVGGVLGAFALAKCCSFFGKGRTKTEQPETTPAGIDSDGQNRDVEAQPESPSLSWNFFRSPKTDVIR